jgi:hypothetical protein
MNQEEQGKKMQQVIAKAWMDDGFKQMLLADPAAALKQEGIEVPEGMQIKAVENTDKVFHLVLPPKPTSAELSDVQLDAAAGGLCCCANCCQCLPSNSCAPLTYSKLCGG